MGENADDSVDQLEDNGRNEVRDTCNIEKNGSEVDGEEGSDCKHV